MVVWNRCHGIVAIPGQGIAPWHAALTDSDVVTVGDAPVTVECVMLLRPVMSTALLSRGYIQEMDGDLGTNTHSCRNANDDGSQLLSHSVELSKCHGIVAITGQGFAPCLPL